MKTNGQLRTKVWWPSKNKDEERKCRNIGNILVSVGVKVSFLLSPHERAWQEITADLLGP